MVCKRVFRNMARMVFKYAILILALLPLTGCSVLSLGRPALASEDPALKIPAMKSAARDHDQSAIPLLIKALSSQDSAIRFYAIYALRKITGHQFGYIYYASEHRRKIAIRRWRKWFAAQHPTGAHAAVFDRRVPAAAWLIPPRWWNSVAICRRLNGFMDPVLAATLGASGQGGSSRHYPSCVAGLTGSAACCSDAS